MQGALRLIRLAQGPGFNLRLQRWRSHTNAISVHYGWILLPHIGEGDKTTVALLANTGRQGAEFPSECPANEGMEGPAIELPVPEVGPMRGGA